MEQYEQPLVACVQLIREQMEEILKDASHVLLKYPGFKDKIMDLVREQIDANEKKAINNLLIHIEAQKAFINTKHPQFRNPYDGEVDEGIRVTSKILLKRPGIYSPPFSIFDSLADTSI